MINHHAILEKKWENESKRPGALGFLIRDHLLTHPTTCDDYEEYVCVVREKNAAYMQYEDWFLPSIVECLTDWSYDEKSVYCRISNSPLRLLWMAIFPHAWEQMTPLDLTSVFRWEAIVDSCSLAAKKTFYKQLTPLIAKNFVSMELHRERLNDIRWDRLRFCLNADYYNQTEQKSNQPWALIYKMLTNTDWLRTNTGHDAFDECALKWMQHANIDDPHYLEQATELLQHPWIQWLPKYLDIVIARLHNQDEQCKAALVYWSSLKIEHTLSREYVPFTYLFDRWTTWDIETIKQIVLHQDKYAQKLQRLLLEHHDYPLSLKEQIMTYRCKHNLIDANDIQKSKSAPQCIRETIFFWVLYRTEPLNKVLTQSFKEVYELHPLYEQDALINKYLPGYRGLRHVMRSMELPWSQAWAYTKEAIVQNNNRKNSLTLPTIDTTSFLEDVVT